MSKDEGRTPQSWLRYSHLGLQFALTLVLAVLAGAWADRKFGTDPWLTITGSLIGIGGGMWVLIREAGS